MSPFHITERKTVMFKGNNLNKSEKNEIKGYLLEKKSTRLSMK